MDNEVMVVERWTSQLYQKYVQKPNGERILLQEVRNPQLPYIQICLEDLGEVTMQQTPGRLELVPTEKKSVGVVPCAEE